MSERYKVVEGSESGHFCFEATVVDTQTPNPMFCKELVCECFNMESAQKIADALNAASQPAEQQPVAEVKYGGYASGNELVWTKGAGLQFLPEGTKLYAASVHAPTPVAYLDVGAGGYMYLGTDLTEDQVGSLPWGRHMLAIVGTYGADGYVPAEWPFDYAEAYQVAQQDLAIWKRRALEAERRVRDQDQIIDRMGDDLNAINGPTFMGEPLYASPQPAEQQPAPDVAALVEALRRIADLPIDPCSTENDYRLSAAKALAAGVLADHRSQGGEV